MGSGSGIQAKTCIQEGFKRVRAVDIDKEAVKKLKEQGLNAVHSNLFENVKGFYDLFIFNPPYLPYDPLENSAITIGGYKIIIKFLEGARCRFNKRCDVLVVFSSLSNPKLILDKASKLGYTSKLLSKKEIFFETLYCYLFH